MATENAPAPAPAHSAPAPAPRFSSFHRTLQEETLAKLVKIGPDYWNRIQEYHDHFDRLQQARAHLEAQAEVVRACAAAMDALHDKARANQSVITNQFGPVTIQDMDDVSMLLTSMRHFEWDVVAPYRARVYPDPDWYTAVPCFPARMEKALPITAQDVLDHSPLLEHIFCDPYPDFSQGAVDAARAYLEAIAEPAVEGAAASPSLSAVREPLHADIRPFAQLWSTVLQVFAPGPEDPFYEHTVEYDPPADWESAVLYTALGPNGATGPQSLDVQAGDRILVVDPDKARNNVVEAYHLTPRRKDSLTHGLVSYVGCLVEVGESGDTSATCADATETAAAAEPERRTIGRTKPSLTPDADATRFFDATERYISFRRAVQDAVAVVAVRSIRGMNELALRTDALTAELHQQIWEERAQMEELGVLQDACEVPTRATRRARVGVAVVEPSYLDAILWLIILSRTPA